MAADSISVLNHLKHFDMTIKQILLVDFGKMQFCNMKCLKIATRQSATVSRAPRREKIVPVSLENCPSALGTLRMLVVT